LVSLKKKLGKKLYDLVERASEGAMHRLEPFAYPGRDRKLPPVTLVTLPKAGSIFIHKALRQTLQVPLVKINASYTFGTSLRYANLQRLAAGNAICREHFEADPVLVDAMARVGIRKLNIHVRDPRGAVVSWTRNMERSDETGGLVSMMLHCQHLMPDAYPGWSFQDRLAWQVEHHLPRYVAWIADWMALVDRTKGTEFRVTTYEDFARDNRGFVLDLLRFFEVPFEDSWVNIPEYKVGSANVFSKSGKSTAEQMGDALYAKATAMLPPELAARFGWIEPQKKLASA
jgi:hypothetical protein